MQRLVNWTRDWRVRVLVPVLAINVAAFGGLYWLMYRYAMSNLVNTHKFAATMLLDQIELDLRDLKVAHNRALLRDRLDAHGGSNKLLAINVYSPDGHAIGSTHGIPNQAELAQVRIVLSQPGHPAMWVTEGTMPRLFGVRALRNGPTCMQCHTGADVLGAIQIGVDIAPALTSAKQRVRRNFLMAGLAWVGLLGLMFWTGGIVIGKPLHQMREAIKVAGAESEEGRGSDLEALATRVHDTLWGLIRAQREREDEIARGMARAEQLAALGQLAAGLTHEIKNPLAGVSAALELLRDEGEANSANREVYDQMLAELRRVTTTVEGLLRLAKPKPPQRIDVDMTRVVAEVTSLFAARLRRQGVALELDVAESVPLLQLDSSLIVQLLMNLLTNSMQATDRGGKIKVLLAPFPRHDGVVLAVSDTGKGIAPEHLDMIFDPFFTTKEEGTGLGMAICRQIVEQHGGTMQVESEVGKGTRVVVLLPDLNAAQAKESHGVTAAG